MRKGQHIIHADIFDGAARHIGKQGVVGVLNDGKAPLPLDFDQPCRAVVEHSRKQDAYHAAA